MYSRPKSLLISDPKVIEMLSKKKSILMLQAFAQTPRSMKQAAQSLEISMSNCHYWVSKFLRLGVLSEVFSQRRAGSTIKYYWMTADTLVSPLGQRTEMLEKYYETLISIYGNLTQKGAMAVLSDLDLDLSVEVGTNSQGYLYYKLIHSIDGKESSLYSKLLQLDSPAMMLSWGSLELGFEDAKDFQRELSELLSSYENKKTGGQKGYYYQVTLVPETD